MVLPFVEAQSLIDKIFVSHISANSSGITGICFSTNVFVGTEQGNLIVDIILI